MMREYQSYNSPSSILPPHFLPTFVNGDKWAILRLLIYAAGTFVRRMGWPNVTSVASIFPGIRKHNPGITISMAPINSERGTINLIWHLLISGISTYYSQTF